MAKPYFTLIVEGVADKTFLNRQLSLWGVIRQRIDVVDYPAGENAGEQHVRQAFPRYLQESRKKHSRKYLVVMTDADQRTVPDRRQQLDDELKRAGQALVTGDEPTVVLIPKRHLEAWLLFFDKGTIDEANKHKNAYRNCMSDVCKVIAPKLDAWLNEASPAGPPSLLAARTDLLRLRVAARS